MASGVGDDSVSCPRVAVIIPCYNAAAYIEKTLASVYRQSGVELEVIVVDDGSSEGGAEVVAARFPQVRLERTPNRGPSAARDLGTKLTQAPLVQYLDADDLLEEGKLAVQAAALARENADVAYGDWVRFRSTAEGAEEVLGVVSRRLGADPELDLFTHFWCPPAAYLIRRSILQRVQWSPRLPVIQDARFMLDCAMAGARFVACPGIMARYRVHTRGSVSTRSRLAFLEDCLRNADEVADCWAQAKRLDGRRRAAVADVATMVAVGSYETSRLLFTRAVDLLERICPEYMPATPSYRRWLMRVCGPGRALAVECRLRRWKRALAARDRVCVLRNQPAR